MAVVQETFDIPTNIMTKILTGEYRRIGGVVRDASGSHKGQIVKLLKPVNMKASKQTQGVSAKMIQFAKINKKTLILVGAAVGIATAGAGIYHKLKNHEPKVVINFRAALKEYIAAIRAGKMDVEVIDKLMASLDELKESKDFEKISIKLSTEELDIFVNRICEYTTKLAKDNFVQLSDEEQVDSGSTIVNLQNYLKTQKRVFGAA